MDDANAALPRFTEQNASDANSYGEASALVALHSDANPGGESFPVLKAFQDYLEAERIRSRQRTTMLTVIFASIIAIVLVTFGLIWHSSIQSSREREAMLWKIAMEVKSQPAAPQVMVPAQPKEDTKAVVAEAVTKAQADQAALFADKLDQMNKLVAKIQDDNTKLQKALDNRANTPAPVANKPSKISTSTAKHSPPPQKAKASPKGKAAQPVQHKKKAKTILSIPTVPPPPAPKGYASGSYGIRIPKEPNPLPWHIYTPMK